MLDAFRGNQALKESLQAALRAGRLSHSVLLCGEAGCGSGFAARCLAADYLYPEGGPQANAVLEGRAAECIEVRGEGASGEIRIDAVRQVRRKVFETALSANGRAVIFYGAQKMNASSANALLKVLEEPPEGVLFVLTATSAAAVLPTIRSRCAIYPIAPVTRQECVAWLRENCPDCKDPELLAAVYDGHIGRAAAAAREPQAAQSFETACQLAQAVAKSDRYRLMQLLAGYEKDKPAAARLLADLASVAAAELAGAGRFGMSAHQAARTASQCGEALQNMNRNLNQKLLLTLLAARIAR